MSTWTTNSGKAVSALSVTGISRHQTLNFNQSYLKCQRKITTNGQKDIEKIIRYKFSLWFY